MGAQDLLSALLHGLQLAEHELLLFAAFWIVVGAIDEFLVDSGWLWLRLSRRARTGELPRGFAMNPLHGKAAVLVPAWQEADVIEAMIRHTLRAWAQSDFCLFVGCYRNDPATLSAAMAGAALDARVRLVVHDRDGPSTKADCLNRLYRALCDEEMRGGRGFGSVILHDAEDMVHPAALAVIDRGLLENEFVQLPVRPEPQPSSPWVAGHYTDEFTESHAKAMVFRDAIGAGLPAAGVGCGFARSMLGVLAARRVAEGEAGPFAAECLTEDYELGLLITRNGGRSRFLRLRDEAGRLVATRSFFPANLDESVRQKTRWIHGIALQGWERLGWSGRLVDIWMALRDRRGPLTAIVLAAAYLLLLVEIVLGGARIAGWHPHAAVSPLLAALLVASSACLVWRMVLRFVFTAREYGTAEGLRAVLRMPVANVITILAGRRALHAYVRSLNGAAPVWDKTRHYTHPAAVLAKGTAP